jgi:hypothetical protein
VVGAFVSVSAGGFHTCGLNRAGWIECFGSDGSGQSNKGNPFKLNVRQKPGYGRVRGDSIQCPKNHYSRGGDGALCEPCEIGYTSTPGSTECKQGKVIGAIIERLNSQKEEQNDLSIKNSRLWQKEQIRMHHDKMMAARKEKDNRKEKGACEAERKDGTIIFPAIEIENEIEDIEDTTCIDTNRDEMLKSFCSFRSDLDNLFHIQNIKKEAKTFWPNICCKERRDKTLEACNDPSGNRQRGEIVPFALSSGGNYSRHNLYVEVTDTIKKWGYLHKGMNRLINTLPKIGNQKRREVKKLIGAFFNDVSLCGPRIVDAPGAKEKTKLCELFVPYKHAMGNFFELIESLYQVPIPQPAFLETMEKSLDRRHQFLPRLGKGGNVGAMMQAKKKDTKKTCSPYGSRSNIATNKRAFCKGYNHLDLSGTNVKNIAVHYIEKDILPTFAKNDRVMNSLKHTLRYQVKDSSCPSPLFTANDISIQQVAIDALGTEKEWVAVVNLNTKDDDGYLQSELPYCKVRNYLIGSAVQVKAYVDSTLCCDGLKDYSKCMATSGCSQALKPLKNRQDKHYSKEVVLLGTQYTVNSISRRRRLLTRRKAGC